MEEQLASETLVPLFKLDRLLNQGMLHFVCHGVNAVILILSFPRSRGPPYRPPRFDQ